MSPITQLQPLRPGMQINEMIDQFKNETGELKFRCIDDRGNFADDLFARVNNNTTLAQINQRDTSLCGPAAFMYCITQSEGAKYRTEYVRYVLDLARIGRGALGNLKVVPRDCLYQAKLTGIEPVDWVALASLRDTYNSGSSLCTPTSGVGGMTLPKDLADWFSGSSWFRAHRAETGGRNIYLPTPSPLDNLLEIVPGVGHICLLVNSTLLIHFYGNSSSQQAVPDHWIVLCSSIQIDGRLAPHQYRGSEDMLKKPVKFECWSWGEKKTITVRTVKEFLSFYYGYVNAIPA